MTGRTVAWRELGRVLAPLDEVFDDLEPLSSAFRDLIAARRATGDQATPAELAELRPLILSLLAEHRGWASGAGVITAPGLLRSTPRWLEWWWARPSGGVEALRANLDEDAPDFFDYTTAEWYSVPAASRSRHAAGPYVDYLCTNEYAVTLSSPIYLDDELIGIAGADVLVSSIERRVLPVLMKVPSGATLTNSEGRVIASAAAGIAAGHRLDLATVTSRDLARHRHASSASRWRLVQA